MLGPAAFGLDLRTSVLVIVFFNAVMCLPPAWLATNGPRTGMRQMVQARYGMGYVPVMLIGLANCLTLLGFLALMTILGGQCLSLASGSEMSWNVGIAVVSIIGLLVSVESRRVASRAAVPAHH
jgi:purine-cytosine permease-like protein